MNLGYRKDIDGLRGISVLSVLLNHAGIGLFPGGFIGVDIFFVISGYLITAIIVREIQSNQFSLIRFYERRMRRILPALLVVIAFTVAVCAILYDAEKFKDFGKSVIATALFASNINFWKEAGYFDAPSQLKPLLHTWSLAVEEQFYIFFPLFLFALYRYARKNSAVILAGTAMLSFGFAVHATFYNPSAAFYLAHLRAWELLIGGMLALNLATAEFGKRYANLIGFAGLALIAIPIFRYTEFTKFPGLSALAPVLGAALILFSGIDGKSLAARFLSLTPLVFIGKISYSLYLWHWPLIIFAKYYMIRPLTSVELAVVITATLLVSALSWRLVETPFRSKDFISSRQVFIFAAGGMSLMLLAGGIVFLYQGFPEREGTDALAAKNKKGDAWLFKECDINHTENPASITTCKLGDRNLEPSFMLWGDSHAPTYGKAVHNSALQNNVSGVLTYDPGCPALLDIIPTPDFGKTACLQYNRMTLSYLKEHPEIHTVILASRWTIWLEENRYKEEEGANLRVADALGEAPANAGKDVLFTLGLERTIKALIDLRRNVIVIAPLPEIGYDVPSVIFVTGQTGRDANEIIAPSIEEYFDRNQKTFAALESFREKYEIQIIEPWKYLCDGGICRVAIDGVTLYNDDDHLSLFGAELITPVFNPVFETMEQSSK